MTMLSDEDRRQIAEQIAEIERHTDAELVTVLAARSDDYRYIPILWAALIALAVPSLLLFAAFGAVLVVGAQLATFCLFAVLFRLPALQYRLIPRSVRHWRAANMARRQFLDRGLHHTTGDTGVLLFVSEAEHYVEILVDRGISDRVADARWAEIVDAFVAAVRAGDTRQGFNHALTQCGKILAATVPKTADNRNELDNRLILIGYD